MTLLTQAACSSGTSSPKQQQVAGESGTGGASLGGTSTGGTSDSGGTSNGGDTSSGDAGTKQGESGAAGQGGSPPSARESGQVTIASFYFTRESGLGYSGIGAAFGPESLHPECTRQDFGLCGVETCGAAPAPSRIVNAGAITVRSDAAGQGPFEQTIEPGADGQYTTWTKGLPVFYPNNVLQVVASGGAVPAFNASPLIYPEDFKLISPTVAATDNHIGTLSISRSGDFELAWDKHFDDVILSIQTDPAVQPGLVCRVPSNMGKFTIPKAALSQIPAGTAGDFYVLRQAVVPAGNFDVTLRLATLLLNPDRSQRIVFEVTD
ncbi:MAG: hypothetical protein ABUL60_34915 [Myxococcales bacterium]